MSAQKSVQKLVQETVKDGNEDLWSQDTARDETHAWDYQYSDFVLIAQGKPPSRIELARERMLICRLYLGLLQTITDDYGTEFAAQSDSLTLRTIGIYVFLRTVMCSPVRVSQIAHALKLPRPTVLRRLQDLVKDGYVERVGNAYRVTDKVNIPDLQNRLQRRIDMVTDTAKKLSELGPSDHGYSTSPPIASTPA
jgi:predicted transcriptional regulator